MSDHPTTEHDLRSALRSLAPEDLDAAPFRARVDRLLDEHSQLVLEDPVAESDIVLLPLDRADRPRRGRASRASLIVTTAACAAAVIAILLAVRFAGHSDRREAPASRACRVRQASEPTGAKSGSTTPSSNSSKGPPRPTFRRVFTLQSMRFDGCSTSTSPRCG